MDIFIIKIINSDNVHRELLQSFQKREISDRKRWNSHCLSYLMIDRILRDFYHIEDREIIFDGNKPILKSGKKHFSLSHSGMFIALAFSDYNCGIDIEEIKLRDFNNIAKRMGFVCQTLGEFYDCWTRYEAEYKLSVPSQKTKTFKMEDYSLSAASTNVKEEFEIYMQNSEYIP